MAHIDEGKRKDPEWLKNTMATTGKRFREGRQIAREAMETAEAGRQRVTEEEASPIDPELREARERIAELERQLEEAKTDRLNADKRIVMQRNELNQLGAIYRAMVGHYHAASTLYSREKDRREDAEAICADLLNMVREKGEGDRFWLEKYLTSAAERSDARQERDTLLETVATQAQEIERLKQLTEKAVCD